MSDAHCNHSGASGWSGRRRPPPKPSAVKPAVKAAPPSVKLEHKYTAKQAEAIALRKYHGKLFGHTSLLHSKHHTDFAVHIRTAKYVLLVMVNANSGKIGALVKSAPKGTLHWGHAGAAARPSK